jgi:hypothetical protein
MKFIRKRNYWAFLPIFVLLRVALPVNADAGYDWMTPWEEEPTEEVTEAPQGEADPTWATELAKTACKVMCEGTGFTASIIFATASHAVDYNDQLVIQGDTADMEILSLEIGNAIVSECRTTAVNAFDAESIPVSQQVYFKQ